jgi:hypothetical protein
MEIAKKLENFPWWVVTLSNLVSLGLYGLGFSIMIRLGYVAAIAYLVYVAVLEYRIMRYHCVDCYYWGRTCGFGKGRISAILFQKGDASKFCNRSMTWKDMIPDLMVTLIPFITGIVLLIIEFNFIILAALVLLVLLTTMGNGFVRGKLTCSYCMQKDLGCPADALFNKKKE